VAVVVATPVRAVMRWSLVAVVVAQLRAVATVAVMISPLPRRLRSRRMPP
jgi:hypothetical protein